MAGVNADSVAGNLKWSRRLRLPYPLLSDARETAAAAFGGLMRIGIGGWSLKMFRRRTVLAGRDGMMAGVWERVHIRGHAQDVLRAARLLDT